MSVRVHFNEGVLRKCGAKDATSSNGIYQVLRLPSGLDILRAPWSGPYLDLHTALELARMPEMLEGIPVVELTAVVNPPNPMPYRPRGEYEYYTARAVLENSPNQQQAYSLKLSAKKLEDMQELYRLIKEGLIYPVGRGYEAEMVPAPHRHLKQLLGEMVEVVRRDVTLKLQRLHRA